jgi:hypothetical protein
VSKTARALLQIQNITAQLPPEGLYDGLAFKVKIFALPHVGRAQLPIRQAVNAVITTTHRHLLDVPSTHHTVFSLHQPHLDPSTHNTASETRPSIRRIFHASPPFNPDNNQQSTINNQ